ncbi:MAG: hypothetical protein RQ723_13400, partial [Desulfuromonadales bacterium]|nr:hypothetical protein [Desulfuromonadales bacterium]
MIAIRVADKPSNSKGWARYRLMGDDGRYVVESRTGNEWVSSSKSGEAQDGESLTLDIDVMLRVGKGRTAREERTQHTVALVAATGAKANVRHYPGSQGMWLQITGARLA